MAALILSAILLAFPLQARADSIADRDAVKTGPHWFRFDESFVGSPALTFDFYRGIEITLPGAIPLGADEPRYEPRSCLAVAPVVEMVRQTNACTILLGSGLDHDGQTPLLVLNDRGLQTVDVFTVAGEALLAAEVTGEGRNRTYIGGTTKPDLLQGAIPDKAYLPRSAVVCHGLIVVLCVVMMDLDPPNDMWVDTAIAFVVSNNAGLTWDLAWEDSVANLAWPRGREWCMQNWWPMERGAAPTEAFFVATDYLSQPLAQGGRTYLMRATRLAAGAPWSLEPGSIVYESSGMNQEHFHTAGVSPLPGGGLAALTSVGDSQLRNRLVLQTRDDHDYLAPGWDTQADYHGSRGDPDVGDWGREGNQFVGCAPGPTGGEVLVGSDLSCEQIMRIPSADLSAAHPRTQHTYGLSLSGDDNRAEVFLIRTPTPELGGPYFAQYSPRSTGDAPVEAKRVLYSEQGIDWAQVFCPAMGNYRGCIHGEHIYIDSLSNSAGLRRLATPKLYRQQPLRVGAGGYQRCVEEPGSSSGPHGEIEPLQRDELGRWIHDGAPLDPQPPTSGQVYHITASRWAAGVDVGAIGLSGTATDVGYRVPGDSLQLRCWLMNNAPYVTAHPGLELRDTGGHKTFLRRPSYACVDKWFPCLGVTSSSIAMGTRAFLQINGTNGQVPDDADFFLALDTLVEGVGLADYALPPDSTPDQRGTRYPDEYATVTGFECGEAWTITLAGQLPTDSWDGHIQTTQHWPLATLWGDAENYIEIQAFAVDPDNCHLVARVIRDGAEALGLASERIYWLRGSAVLVSLADAGDGSGVRMSVSVGGQKAHEARAFGGVVASPVTPPQEIRFRSHHGAPSDGTDVRVTPMLWWGGEIRPQEALPAPERQALLQTLSFLDEDSIPGDIDGDGDVDQSDLGLLLVAYGISDGGDIDGDGDTDQADLSILLSNYGYGT